MITSRQFWIPWYLGGLQSKPEKIYVWRVLHEKPENEEADLFIEHSAYVHEVARSDALEKDFSTKLQRTVRAAYHALLEMSAWLGIPEHKRIKQVEQLMENVKYCAEHDLKHVDESQRNNALVAEIKALQKVRDELLEHVDISAEGPTVKLHVLKEELEQVHQSYKYAGELIQAENVKLLSELEQLKSKRIGIYADEVVKLQKELEQAKALLHGTPAHALVKIQANVAKLEIARKALIYAKEREQLTTNSKKAVEYLEEAIIKLEAK